MSTSNSQHQGRKKARRSVTETPKAAKRAAKRHRFRLKAPAEIVEVLDRINRLPAEEPDVEVPIESSELEALYIVESWNLRHELFEARRLLRFIIRAGQSDFIRQTGGDFQLHPTGRPSPFRLEARLSVIDGNLELSPESVLAKLRGQPVQQIRMCKVCSKLFWAGRPKQVCCSTRCSRIERTRRWRESKQRYKENRAGKE
jgi:hypothetical protein